MSKMTAGPGARGSSRQRQCLVRVVVVMGPSPRALARAISARLDAWGRWNDRRCRSRTDTTSTSSATSASRPTPTRAVAPVRELVELLGDIDDPAVVVVAGNLFAPDADAGLATRSRATLERLPGPRRPRCAPSLANPEPPARRAARHRRRRAVPATSAAAGAPRGARRRRWRSDLDAPGRHGRRRARPGRRRRRDSTSTSTRADPADRADADAPRGPHRAARFVASRVLYRRLGAWVWLPVLALVGCRPVQRRRPRSINHFTHEHVHVHAPHTDELLGQPRSSNLLAVVALEALVAASPGLIVRRRFERGARARRAPRTAEPLAADPASTSVDALEFARRIAERGGAGAVVGGAPRPALAFLDRGGLRRAGTLAHGRRRAARPLRPAAGLQLGRAPRRRRDRGREHGPGAPLRRRGAAARAARLLERLVGRGAAPGRAARGHDDARLVAPGHPLPGSPSTDCARSAASARCDAGRAGCSSSTASSTSRSPRRRRCAADSTGAHRAAPRRGPVGRGARPRSPGIAMIMLARGVRRGQRRAWFLAVAGPRRHGRRAPGARRQRRRLADRRRDPRASSSSQRRHFQATTDRTSLRARRCRAWRLVAGRGRRRRPLGIEAPSAPPPPARLRRRPDGLRRAARRVTTTASRLPDRVGDFVNPALLRRRHLAVRRRVLPRDAAGRRPAALAAGAPSAERRLAELRAREIVRRHGRGTLDYFALRDDKQFFFFRDSLVAYAVYGGVALISPDPIGPDGRAHRGLQRVPRLRRGARLDDRRHGRGRGVAARSTTRPACTTSTSATRRSSTARPSRLEGGKMKGLRQACTRLARHGYTVEFLDPADDRPRRGSPTSLELISMLRRGEGERGFSMMLGRLFDPKDKGLLLTVVHGPDGTPGRGLPVRALARRSTATHSTSCAATPATTPTA